MKNLYKQVKTLILRNKVSDFEYDCVKTEIYQTNLLMLEVCSLVGCVLFFVLGIVGLFFNSFPNARTIGCFAVFAVMLFIFILSIKISQEKLKLAVPLLYVFIWTLSVFMCYFSEPHDRFGLLSISRTIVPPDMISSWLMNGRSSFRPSNAALLM